MLTNTNVKIGGCVFWSFEGRISESSPHASGWLFSRFWALFFTPVLGSNPLILQVESAEILVWFFG